MRLTTHFRFVSHAAFVLLTCVLCAELSEARAADAKLQPRQIRKIVNRINRIESLPSKAGAPVNDPHARAILALGVAAAPYLAEKLTDTSDSRVAYLFRYKIGDVALYLLRRIYEPLTYPFPDDSETIPRKYGDYRDQMEYLASQGARGRLRKSWEKYIRQSASRPNDSPSVPNGSPATRCVAPELLIGSARDNRPVSSF